MASGYINIPIDVVGVPSTRTINTTAPLSGGGDLSVDRTIAISQATTVANGYLTSTDWNTFNGKVSLLATGTRASPQSITAVGGITAGAQKQELQFIAGSGGAVVVTANPQVSAGAFVGQSLLLKGTHDTNTVQISDGTGLELNGNYVMKNKSQILLVWDGTIWGEVARNDL